jgi:hypothetical protein
MNANRMIAVSLLGALPLLGLAQASKVCNGKDANNKDISGIACNGISVGRPKVFDNRSLTLKMEDLAKTLKTQQAANSPVDLKTVVAAINNLQGLSQQETDTSLSVVGNATPSRTLSKEVKAGNVDSNGNPLPNTTDRNTQTIQASVAPQAPSFDSFGSLPSSFNPTFGNSASDILTDQVNLSYQITNLQMLIERSLSDRPNGT